MSRGREIRFTVPPGIDGVRADKVVHAECAELSRAAIQRLFEAGRVWLENTALGKSDKVRTGDVITFSIPAPQPLELRAAPIPLEVLFEDRYLIVVNKPAGMIVHPGSGTGDDTLVHALLHHCSGTLSGIGGVERPGIVHRLDKDTSGAIVAAKTDRAHTHLAGLFAAREVAKSYLAITAGIPPETSGKIDAPMGRHRTQRVKMAVVREGRSASSEWEVEEVFGASFALLRVRIHTGRTHQIRVHLAHIGFPVAGDPLYGKRQKGEEGNDFPRCMLHAHRLRFTHPEDGREIDIMAPLPEDIRAVISSLRGRG